MENGSLIVRRQIAHRGFTYLGVLAILAVMMVAMGAVTQVWHTQMQRENEKELLFVGNQIRNAIGRYFKESGRGYPTSLQVLLGADGDAKLNKRYLRKIYRDPITGGDTWGLVLANNGLITGVYSLSGKTPFKQADFAERDSEFEGKTKYSEWQFTFAPANSKAGVATAGNATNSLAGAPNQVSGIETSVNSFNDAPGVDVPISNLPARDTIPSSSNSPKSMRP